MIAKQEHLERKLLLSILLVSLLLISIYLVYDLVTQNYTSVLLAGISLLLYGGILAAHYLGFKPHVIKAIIIIVTYQSIGVSFFFLNGFSKIASLDILNASLMIIMFYSGRTRNILLTVFFAFVATFIAITYLHPEYIQNTRANDPFYIELLVFSCRILTAIIVGWMVKEAYIKNAEQVMNSYKELDGLHQQVTLQYQQLKALNEQITQLNEQLEARVNERTERLKNRNAQITSFIYMNSHLLRAPISKLLAVHHFLKATKSIDETIKVIDAYQETIIELDTISRKINASIEKDLDLSDAEMMQLNQLSKSSLNE